MRLIRLATIIVAISGSFFCRESASAVLNHPSSRVIISEQRTGPEEQAKLWTVNSTIVTPSEDLVDLEMLDENNGKAIGDHGSIFETADGGKSWQRIGRGLPGSSFHRIYFVNRLLGWALSWKPHQPSDSIRPEYDASLLQTQDGGRSWIVQHTVNKGSLNGIVFSNKDEGWAVGRTFQKTDGIETERILVLRTMDQGRHWQDLSRSLGEASMTGSAEDILSDGPSKAAILTYQGAILLTSDAGQTWRSIKAAKSNGPRLVNLRLLADGADRLLVLSSANSREVFGARVARVDENHRWMVTDLPDWYISDLKILSPNEMFVCGTGEPDARRPLERGEGILAFSSDGGKSWATIHVTRKSGRINALEVLGPNKLLAVGNDGWIFEIHRK
jgi:photosystem II stability/assembly factor-like uncharacterized protein